MLKKYIPHQQQQQQLGVLLDLTAIAAGKKEVVRWTWSRRERGEGKRQGAIEGEKFRTDVVDTEERETGVSKEEEKRGVAVLGGLPLGRK